MLQHRLHAHTCEDCHHTWVHPDSTPNYTTFDEFERAHTCPACGLTDQKDKAPLSNAFGPLGDQPAQWNDGQTLRTYTPQPRASLYLPAPRPYDDPALVPIR